MLLSIRSDNFLYFCMRERVTGEKDYSERTPPHKR